MSFSIIKPKNFSKILENAKIMAENNGAILLGDESSGKFEVKTPAITGTYKVNDDVIFIDITKKPFLIPEALIKSKLAEFFK